MSVTALESAVLAALADIAAAQPPHVHTLVGNWDIAHPYVIGEGVTYGGSSYTALLAGTGQQPNLSPTYWLRFAAGGLPGNLYPDQTAYSTTTYDGSNRPLVTSWFTDVGLTVPLLVETMAYDVDGNITPVSLAIYVAGVLDHTLTDTVTYDGLGNETARARVKTLPGA